MSTQSCWNLSVHLSNNCLFIFAHRCLLLPADSCLFFNAGQLSACLYSQLYFLHADCWQLTAPPACFSRFKAFHPCSQLINPSCWQLPITQCWQLPLLFAESCLSFHADSCMFLHDDSCLVAGKTCQMWSVETPQTHPNYPATLPGLGEHNNCRLVAKKVRHSISQGVMKSGSQDLECEEVLNYFLRILGVLTIVRKTRDGKLGGQQTNVSLETWNARKLDSHQMKSQEVRKQ